MDKKDFFIHKKEIAKILRAGKAHFNLCLSTLNINSQDKYCSPSQSPY